MKKLAIILMSMFLVMPFTASAVVMDFDSAANGSFLTSDYIEDGFKISVNSGHYDFFGDGRLNIDSVFYGDTTITFQAVDGSAFNWNSLEIFNAANAEVNFYKGATLIASFGWPFDGTWSAASPVFNGITSITFSNLNSAYVEIDNINVTGVPEPSTMLLLGSGLLGLVGYGRRRMKK